MNDLPLVLDILEVAKEKLPRDFRHVSASSLRLYKDSGFSEIVHASTPCHQLLLSEPPHLSEPPTFYVGVGPGVGAIAFLIYSCFNLLIRMTVNSPKQSFP